ncbi:MAG: DUF4149 domain-containing protein [Campylobacterota bacterium]
MQNEIMKKNLTIAYIALLFITLGAVLAAGAFAAPVVFNAQAVLGSGVLSHYQQGLIMTEIFLRLNWLLHLCVLAILLMELYRYKSFQRDFWLLVPAFVAVFCALLFTQYYTPDILAFQAKGPEATQTGAFEAVHKGSELAFKLLAAALAVLGVRNVQKIYKQ